MSLLNIKTTNNLSYYAIPAACAISFLPHLYAVTILNTKRNPGTTGFDFSNPKKSRETIKDGRLSPADADRYLRAEAANDNGFVGLPLFAAAIVAGNVARLPTKTLNNVAGLYLASRLIFNGLYIYGTSNGLGLGRTFAWLVGQLATLSLFVKAGNRLNAAPGAL